MLAPPRNHRWATLRALPTLVRIGIAEAVAYRAEMFVWILTTSMPFVMLALFTAVGRERPLGTFDEQGFAAYFLVTFIIRQFVTSWASWEINFEVRTGTLAMRLMRPVNPILCYAIENLAAMPIRLIIAAPVAIVALTLVREDQLPPDFLGWLMFFVSWTGAWFLSFLINVIFGTLSLWLDQSMKLMDVWMAGYLAFSGYLVPIALFPAGLREAVQWLPFHSQIGLPIELLLGTHPRAEAAALLAVQWGWIALTGLLVWALWRRGVRRFAAYGG